MPRQLNKPFAAMLGSSLVAISLAAAGFVHYAHRRAVDPEQLQRLAEDRERQGDTASALDLYQQAAAASSHLSPPSSAPAAPDASRAQALWLKVADLAQSESMKAADPETALRLYGRRQAALEQALRQNPRDPAPLERIVLDRCQLADLQQSAPAWAAAEELITRGLRMLDPASQAASRLRLYRARARLRGARLVSLQELPESRIDAIEEDLEQALPSPPPHSLPPDSAASRAVPSPDGAMAATMRGELFGLRADRAEARGLLKEAAAFREAERRTLRDFLAEHPADPQATIELARCLMAGKQLEEAIETARTAFERHPDDGMLAEILGRLYLLNAPPSTAPAGSPAFVRAEAVYRKHLAARPDGAEGYLRLARFYQSTGQTAQAVEAFNQVLARTNARAPAGGTGEGPAGIASIQNENWELQSYEALAWLFMDAAESAGPATAAGQTALERSWSYASKLRAAHAATGNCDLIEGRLQLLQANFSRAIAALQRAQAELSPALADQRERLRQSKLLLARANLQLRPPQPGAALKYLEDAIALQPGDFVVMLQRAEVLIQLSQFAQAQAAAEEVLKAEAVLPRTIADDARRLLAAARSGQGDAQGAGSLLMALNSPAALLQLAATQLDADDNDGALRSLEQLLQKDPGNALGLRLSILAKIRQGRPADALRTAEAAVAQFPGHLEFAALRELLASPGGDPIETQRRIIGSISDPYARALQRAGLEHVLHHPDAELAAIEDARAAIGQIDTPDVRQKKSEIVERLFAASIDAAESASGEARNTYLDHAEAAVRMAEQLNADGVYGRLYRGRLDVFRSNGARGIDLLEQAAEQRPDYAPALIALGHAYLLQKREAEALDQFRQALRLVPTHIPLICRTIELLVAHGEPAGLREAQELLGQGLRVAPTDPRLAEFGDLLLSPADAVRTREAILQKQPANVRNIRRLVLLYLRLPGDAAAISRAAELAQGLLQKDPADLDAAELLAAVYARQGGVQKGIDLLFPFTQRGDPLQNCRGWLSLGEYYRHVGRVDEAAQAFAQAIALQPAGMDEAQRRLGDLYFDSGSMRQALEIYQRLVDRAPDGPGRDRVLRRLIETKIRLNAAGAAGGPGMAEGTGGGIGGEWGDRGGGVAQIDAELLAKNPHDAQALLLRALACIQMNQPQRALADLGRILAAHPDDPDALYYRALALDASGGDLSQAIADLRRLEDTHSGSSRSRTLLARLYRRTRRWAEAASTYALLRRDDPEQAQRDDAALLVALVETQQKLPATATGEFAMGIRRAQPIERLRDLVEEARARDPDDPAWALMAADLQALQGHWREAEELYRNLLASRPGDPVVANAYAKALLKAGKWNEAVAISSAMIAKHPDIVDFRLRRAAALSRLGRTADAAADLDAAFAACLASLADNGLQFLALAGQSSESLPPELVSERLRARLAADPHEQVTRIALVQTLIAMRQPDAAAEEAGLLAPAAQRAGLRGLSYKAAGLAHLMSRRYEVAAEEFGKALEEMPDDLDCLNNLACLLAENLGRPREALAPIGRALRVMETSGSPAVMARYAGSLYDTSGWARSLAGDTEGALRDLRCALGYPPTPAACLHLALTLKKAAPARLDEIRDAVTLGLQAATPGDPSVAALEELLKPPP